MKKGYWIKGAVIGGVLGLIIPLLLVNMIVVLVSLGEGVFNASLWFDFFVRTSAEFIVSWGSVSFIITGVILGSIVTIVYRKIVGKKSPFVES